MQGVSLTRIADNLSNQHRIGAQRDKPRQHCRFVQLRNQQLFDRLVSLYTQQFIVSYHAFKHVLRAFEHPPGLTNESNAAARAYISSWFWDLYVSISKSVSKIHSIDGSKYYSHNYIAHISDRYDPFLQHLNSVIRPTHTPHSLEDVLWIPIIMPTPLSTTNNDPTNNPFNIIGWNYNDMEVHAILDTMDNKKNHWRTVPLDHDTLGRPMWLLDWHDDRAYAWFPLEGHFTDEDLVAAYILGLPCTSNLGPRDIDEWNFFPGNIVPTTTLTPAILARTSPRNFYGSAEVRTYNLRNQTRPEFVRPPTDEERASKKLKSSEPTSCDLVDGSFGTLEGSVSTGGTQHDTDTSGMYPQYQIVDWCYHLIVVLDLNSQLQNASFRSFLFEN